MSTYSKSFGLRAKRAKTSGFTLVEIMVVVVIIGLLAGLFYPSIQKKLREGQISTTFSALKSAQQMIQGMHELAYYPLTEGVTSGSECAGSTFAAEAGATLSGVLRFDQLLMNYGQTDKLFDTKLVGTRIPTDTSGSYSTGILPYWDTSANKWRTTGDVVADHDWSSCARIECRVGSVSATPSTAAGSDFKVDGVTSQGTGVRVVYAILPNIPYTTAYDLAHMFNGDALMDMPDGTNATLSQNRGTAVFPAATAGLTTLYVYLASK